MVWNNEIGLADIISIAALIATFITVLLVLVQRHDSTRPFVSIKIKENVTYTASAASNDEFPLSIDDDAITINCFGNGMAKDVSIESYLVLDKDAGFYKRIKIAGGTGEFYNEGKLKLFFLLNPTRTTFNSINCNESEKLTPDIMGKLLGMAFTGLDAVSQADDKSIPISSSSIVFKIVFYDMLGRKYRNYYLVSNMISSFSNDKYSFYLTSEILPRRQFSKLMKIYKKQNCCGNFRGEYTPSYRR